VESRCHIVAAELIGILVSGTHRHHDQVWIYGKE